MSSAPMRTSRLLVPAAVVGLGVPLGLVATGAVSQITAFAVMGLLLGMILVDLVLLPDGRLPLFLLVCTIVGLGSALAYEGIVTEVMNLGRFLAPTALLLVLLRTRLSTPASQDGPFTGSGRALPIALTVLAGISLSVSIDPRTTAMKAAALALVAFTTVALLRWDMDNPDRLQTALTVAFCILILTNVFMLPFPIAYTRARFHGWTSNANTLGMMCGLGIPLLVARLTVSRRRLVDKAAMAVLLVAGALLLLSGSRSGLLAAVMGTATTMRNARIGRSLMFPVFLLAVAVVGPLAVRTAMDSELLQRIERTGSSGREEAWTVGWRLMWDQPMFGAGFATTEQRFLNEEFGRFEVFEGGQFHNSYLEAGVELGVPAAILLCAAGLLALSYTVRPVPARDRWAAGMVVAAATIGFFETGLLTPGSLLFFPFWIALGVVTIGRRATSAPRPSPRSAVAVVAP